MKNSIPRAILATVIVASVGCNGGTSYWAYQSDSGAYNSELHEEQVAKLTKTLFETGKYKSEADAERHARAIIEAETDENLRRHQAGQQNAGGVFVWEKEFNKPD